MTADETRDDENPTPTRGEEPEERHRGARLVPLVLLLAAFLAAVVLIVWLFTSSSPKITGDTTPPPAPTTTTTPPGPKTHVDITVPPKEPDVRLDVHDIAFNPPITAPGDTSTAELVIANTGDTPFYLTTSALLLSHDIDFGPYMDATLTRATSCAATGKELYNGRADRLEATMADAVAPGNTVELCMRMTAQFGIPDGYQNREGQVSLSFTASQLPKPADGPSTTRTTP